MEKQKPKLHPVKEYPVNMDIPQGVSPDKGAAMMKGAFLVLSAAVAHEVNRAYCEAIGDASQEAWEDAPEWQRKSCIAGAANILQHPDTTPAQSHSMWMSYKQQEGWKYGEEKDAEKKTHPCMVPYEDLPSEQKMKDALFTAVVRSTFKIAYMQEPKKDPVI